MCIRDSPLYGARPLNRLIHKQILNPMAIQLLRGQLRHEEIVNVVVKDGKLTVEPNHEPEVSAKSTHGTSDDS